MLLDKFIETPITNNSMAQYYEKLGYKIPRHIDKRKRLKLVKGTKILVNVNDLQPYSTTKVNVQCDICKKIYKLSYEHYLRQQKRKNYDGTIRCNDCCVAYRKTLIGEKSPSWNPNIHKENDINNRKSYSEKLKQIEWSKKILSNYNYTCLKCGAKRNLNAHHLDNWYDNIDKRYSLDNGVCLCEKCHKNFHYLYSYKNNTKQQFEEWINKDIEYKINDDIVIPTARIVIRLEDEFIIYNLEQYGYSLNDKNAGSAIRKVCKNIHSEYKGYHYMYYDEYLKCSEDFIKLKLRSKNRGRKNYIRCLETHIIYNSLKDLAKSLNKNSSTVDKYIKRDGKYMGYHYEYIKAKNLIELYKIVGKEDIIGKEVN